MVIPSRWSRGEEMPPPTPIESVNNKPVLSSIIPTTREHYGKGRPPRRAANPDVVDKGRRQVTSFYLHGDLYDRMKAYLRSVGLSQTEWLEYLIRTELARRGFDQPPPEPTVTSTTSDATAAPTTNPAPSPTPNAKPKKAASKKRSKKRKKPAKVKAAPVDGGAKG